MGPTRPTSAAHSAGGKPLMLEAVAARKTHADGILTSLTEPSAHALASTRRALFAFCSHILFARTLEYPWGLVLELALAPVFLFAFKWPKSPLYKLPSGKRQSTPPSSGDNGEYGSSEPMLGMDEFGTEPVSNDRYGTFLPKG